MTEVWKDIPGYEGRYAISNFGRVKTYDRKVKSPVRNSHEMKERTVKGQILKPEIANNGYLYVCLWKEGKKSKATVHRLVAQAFIPNPDNKPCVNHKDYNRQNPCATNLEWVTHKENMIYSRERLSAAHIGISSTPNKYGEMYVYKTNTGRFKLRIEWLNVNKTFETIADAVNAREVILGW